MVFQKRLTHFLVWVACDSLLRKRMVLHSYTHQPIKCKHAFFKYPQVKLWNDTCLQKSPRGGRVSLSGPRTISSWFAWSAEHVPLHVCWIHLMSYRECKATCVASLERELCPIFASLKTRLWTGTACIYFSTCNKMKTIKTTSVNRLECATINKQCINHQSIH